MQKKMKPMGRKPGSGNAVLRWLETRNRKEPYRRSRALLLALLSGVIQSGMLTLGALDPDAPGRLERGANVPYMAVATTVLFTLLYLYNFRLLREGMKGAKVGMWGLGGSAVLTAAYSAVTWWLEGVLCGGRFNPMVVTLAVNETSTVIAWLLSMLVHNVTRQEQMELENERLQAENLRVHHESLERQVNPHFLFNSLNTLDGLMETDAGRAHRYLHELAETYRYILRRRRQSTLGEELRFTQTYVDMMQIRYGEGLRVETDVEEGLLEREVPPISVQLLVENAIKHNVVSVRHPLTIKIRTKMNGRAFVRVENKIMRRSEVGDVGSKQSGVGLKNLDERCRLMCGWGIAVENDGEWFAVEMPLGEEGVVKV